MSNDAKEAWTIVACIVVRLIAMTLLIGATLDGHSHQYPKACYELLLAFLNNSIADKIEAYGDRHFGNS